MKKIEILARLPFYITIIGSVFVAHYIGVPEPALGLAVILGVILILAFEDSFQRIIREHEARQSK